MGFADFFHGSVFHRVNFRRKALFMEEKIFAFDLQRFVDFGGGTGTKTDPYLIASAEHVTAFNSAVTGGTDYSGKFFKITSGVGTTEQTVGTNAKQFKGTATLAAGIKVKFNGGDTIETTTGEISFCQGVLSSLDNGDKFKIGDTTYTVSGTKLKSSTDDEYTISNGTIFISDITSEDTVAVSNDTIDLTAATKNTIFTNGTTTVAEFTYSTKTLTKKSGASVSGLKVKVNSDTAYTLGSAFKTITDGTNTFTVTASGNYKVEGNKITSGTLSDLKITAGSCTYNGKTYNISGSNVVVVSGGSAYIYSANSNVLSDSNKVATITGLSSGAKIDDFALSGTTVTLKKNALGTSEVKISGSGNFTLALDSDATGSENISAGWSVTNGTAKYNSAGTAQYTVATDSKSITYTVTGSTTSATITGLNSNATASDFTSSGNVITLKASALGGKNISVTGDYTLALASGISAPSYEDAHWLISKSVIEYYSASNTAGYSVSSNKKSVTYTEAEKEQRLAMVAGLKETVSSSDFSLSGTVITLKASALLKQPVYLTGDYTLDLAGDVVESETTPAKFTVSGTKATYTEKKFTEGYVLASDKKSVSYTTAGGGDTLFTVSGLKKNTSASNLSYSDKVVTLKAKALGTKKVTISDGYKLALADDVKKSTATAAGFSVSKTTATYKTKETTAGYTLASDAKSISYTKTASGGDTLVTLSGLKSGLKVKSGKISGITFKNETVTLAQSVLGSDKAASVKGGGYTFALSGAGKLTNVGVAATLKGSSGKDTLIGGTGKDTIYGNSGADLLSGGKGNDYLSGGKGNDTLNGGKGNDTLVGGDGKDIFVYESGGGKDTITDYTAGQDKIKIKSGEISKTTVSDQDVVFTIGSGSITVKNGKGKKITITDANGKTTTKTYKGTSAQTAETFFTDENNFSSADDINSIMKNNLDATDYKVETQNFGNLTTENNFVTYSEK